MIYLVSLARTQKIKTSVGLFSVHHIAAELFDGYESRPDGTKLATPEKALFDIAYLSGGRSRLFSHLPELELPARFRRSRLRAWTRRITASRKRSMVETRLQTMDAMDVATREPRSRSTRSPANKKKSGATK